ncbi:MAG: fluoride efflux transporter CrcB [Acholeplasmataceae bacterium]|nr:fluoride efflux transporter CrcB [Acidaminococcaceae bacterium]NLY84371.1 fluoride efflux transporter CrcB [Acholeplasmataceae bacterium]
MIWLNAGAIALGGAAGALCRYFLSVLLHEKLGTAFPYGTLAINLLACLLLGVTVSFCLRHPEMPIYWKLLAITGFLGGFSTFSTFGLESFELLLNQPLSGLIYLFSSLAGGLAMIALGLKAF